MVYVDDYNAKYGRMTMCHLFADTKEELLEMVDVIGVQRKWIQKEGKPEEHFDICLAKKKLALEHGVKEVKPRDWILIVREKRGKQNEN